MSKHGETYMDVMNFVGQGLTQSEIAARLNISRQRVSQCVSQGRARHELPREPQPSAWLTHYICFVRVRRFVAAVTTRNVAERLRDFESANPYPVQYLGSFWATPLDYQRVLMDLREAHSHGNWHHVTIDVLGFINRICATRGSVVKPVAKS